MSRLADIDELKTFFKKIANEWADGYKDINLEELSESDKKVASALANYMIRTVVIIDEWPTVDAEPIRHGHWEKLYDRNYKCSVCGAWYKTDEEEEILDFDYCPRCGAKMDEVME